MALTQFSAHEVPHPRGHASRLFCTGDRCQRRQTFGKTYVTIRANKSSQRGGGCVVKVQDSGGRPKETPCRPRPVAQLSCMSERGPWAPHGGGDATHWCQAEIVNQANVQQPHDPRSASVRKQDRTSSIPARNATRNGPGLRSRSALNPAGCAHRTPNANSGIQERTHSHRPTHSCTCTNVPGQTRAADPCKSSTAAAQGTPCT